MFGRRNGTQAVTSGSRAKRAWQLELADGSGSERDRSEEVRQSEDKKADRKIHSQRQGKRSPSQESEGGRGSTRNRHERGSSPCLRSAKVADVKHDERRASQRENHRSNSRHGGRTSDSAEDFRRDNGKRNMERDQRYPQRTGNGADTSRDRRRDGERVDEREHRESRHRSRSQRRRGNQKIESMRAGGRKNRSPSRYDPNNGKSHTERHRDRSQSRRSRNKSDGKQGSPSQVGGSEVSRERRSKQFGDDRRAEENIIPRKRQTKDEQSSERREGHASSPRHASPAKKVDEKSSVEMESGKQLDDDDSESRTKETNDNSARRLSSPNVVEAENGEHRSPTQRVDEDEEQTKKKKKTTKEKEYAWMESEDEADGSSEAAPAFSSPSHPVPKEVETLGQMLRLAEHLLGQSKEKLQELEQAEIVDICAAAARVKYYDPALFADALAPTLLYRFRRGLDATPMADSTHLTVEHALDIVSSLAALNATSATPIADVFRAAARALEEHGASLSIPQRRLLKDVYKAGGREKDVAFIEKLASPSDPSAIAAAAFKGSQRAGTNGDGLPMRPGARICEVYAKTGTCRTGPTCRNDHPESLRVTYNSDGYPLRPWAPNCPYYMNQGTCDFRKTCKWHHPDKKERGPGNVSYTSKGSGFF